MDDRNAMLLAEAGRLVADGDVDKAIRSLQSVIRTNPDSCKAHLTLANAYIRKGSGGPGGFMLLAAREFDAAWRVAPADRETHAELLKAGLRVGRLPFLLEEYGNRLKDLPFAGEMVKMGEALEAAGGKAAGSASGRSVSIPSAAKSPVLRAGILIAVVCVFGWRFLAGMHAGAPLEGTTTLNGEVFGADGANAPGGDSMTRLKGLLSAMDRKVPGLSKDGPTEVAPGDMEPPSTCDGKLSAVGLKGNGIAAYVMAAGNNCIFTALGSAFASHIGQGNPVSYTFHYPYVIVVEKDTPGGAFVSALRKVLPGCRMTEGRLPSAL